MMEKGNDKVSEQRVRLEGRGAMQPGPAGRFEVDAISAGEGNGWFFSQDCLQGSLARWDGVECFVDHNEGRAHSVRDLGGVFHAPRWCPETSSVRLELHTLGPCGGLVDELGQQILAQGAEESPRVGFSADLLFTAEGKQVREILKVYSLDLVFNPARGGAFVRSLTAEEPAAGTGERSLNARDGMETYLAEGNQMETEQELQTQLKKMEDTRAELCAHLLEAELASARLPAPAAAGVRHQFAGRAFEPQALAGAIQEARRLVEALKGPGAVSGPHIHQLFDARDQLQAAVDDLLGAPREPGAEGLKAARLSGIKELYTLLTGDCDLYGGYYAERAQFATTANFTGLVKNALNKAVAQQWEELGAAGYDWWQQIVQVEHFETLNQITGVLVGTVGALPGVAEGAEYTELKIGDSPEVANFTKYGGYIPLTLELIDRDDTRKLRLYPRELAKAGLRRISALVSAVFTDNNGTGPVLADGGALFNATAVTTKGGHANLRTAALSASEWEAVKQAVFEQPLLIANEAGYYGTGPRQALHPRYLLAPVELELTAKKILYGEWENAANIHADNLQRQRQGDVIVVPEWEDENNWAAVVDPRLAPGIVLGERFGLVPEIFVAGDELSPAVFMNDEHRIKVRHFVAVLAQDFRALHKSNVG